jgi:hypothetical protein
MINKLVEEIKIRGGFARSNKFSIEISRGNNNNMATNTDVINVLCESVSLPGKQITTTEYSIARNNIKYPTGYINEDVELSFALTNDYYIRKYFDEWIDSIIPSKDYYLNYRTEYVRDVTITQLGEKNEKIYSHKLIDAYPITMQNIALSNSVDDDVSRFSVTLTYDKYEIINHK